MIKIIEFCLLFALVYWAIYIFPKRRKLKRQNSGKSSPPPKPQILKMVECSFCKIRLPLQESFEYQQRNYCSLSHYNQISPQGWLGCAKQVPSPNFDERPEGVGAIDTVVIHHISLPEGKFGSGAIEAFFTNRLNPKDDPYYETIAHLQVSSHFLILRDGQIVQFVATNQRAWHAGASKLIDRERVNDFSIGIELEGTGDLPFEPEQYQKLGQLLTAILKQYDIQYFVGHSDISPGRKTDPGKSFDWKYVSQIAKIPENKLPFGIESR
jgi:AmpD protein